MKTPNATLPQTGLHFKPYNQEAKRFEVDRIPEDSKVIFTDEGPVLVMFDQDDFELACDKFRV